MGWGGEKEKWYPRGVMSGGWRSLTDVTDRSLGYTQMTHATQHTHSPETIHNVDTHGYTHRHRYSHPCMDTDSHTHLSFLCYVCLITLTTLTSLSLYLSLHLSISLCFSLFLQWGEWFWEDRGL